MVLKLSIKFFDYCLIIEGDPEKVLVAMQGYDQKINVPMLIRNYNSLPIKDLKFEIVNFSNESTSVKISIMPIGGLLIWE